MDKDIRTYGSIVIDDDSQEHDVFEENSFVDEVEREDARRLSYTTPLHAQTPTSARHTTRDRARTHTRSHDTRSHDHTITRSHDTRHTAHGTRHTITQKRTTRDLREPHTGTWA
jgi:hypothetical protein